MKNIEILKRHFDIADVAVSLGWRARRDSGGYLSGDCPTGHDSRGHQCFVIWSEIQGFRCYHCGESGDVIALVQLLEKCDFRTAVEWLAQYAGVEVEEQTPEQKARYEEQKLVHEILTAGARFYHTQLMEDREMHDSELGYTTRQVCYPDVVKLDQRCSPGLMILWLI